MPSAEGQLIEAGREVTILDKDLCVILRDALREWKSGGVYFTNGSFRYRSDGSVVPWSRAVSRRLGHERFFAVSQWLNQHGFSVPDEPEVVVDVVLSALVDRVARELGRIREELDVIDSIRMSLAAWEWPIPYVMDIVEHLARTLRLQVNITLTHPPFGASFENEEEAKA